MTTDGERHSTLVGFVRLRGRARKEKDGKGDSGSSFCFPTLLERAAFCLYVIPIRGFAGDLRGCIVGISAAALIRCKPSQWTMDGLHRALLNLL